MIAATRLSKFTKNAKSGAVGITSVEMGALSTVRQMTKQYLASGSCPYYLVIAREHGGTRHQLVDINRSHRNEAAETGILQTFFVNSAEFIELKQILARTTVIKRNTGGFKTPNIGFDVTGATCEALQAYEIILSRRIIIDKLLSDLSQCASSTSDVGTSD